MAKRKVKSKIEIPTHEAKTQLSRYLKLVSEGTEVTIKRGSTPIARLVPIPAQGELEAERPAVGSITSRPVRYTKDCFAPLDEQALKEWGL